MHGDHRWTNHGLPRHRGTLPHHIRTLKQKPQSVKRVGCVCVSQVWSIGNSICFRLGPKLLKCPLNESKSKLNFYDLLGLQMGWFMFEIILDSNLYPFLNNGFDFKSDSDLEPVLLIQDPVVIGKSEFGSKIRST